MSYPWTWHWVSLHMGKDAEPMSTIAIHLIMEFWRCEAEHQDVDHFHWINNTGLLDVAEIKSIAVW